jgi:integrase
MARKPSPWYWPERNGWFTILNGQRQPLGNHPADAPPPQKRKGKWIAPLAIEQVFHALLAAPAPCDAQPIVATVASTGLTVADVYEKYLDWCLKHRSARSYEWYKKHIQLFLDFLPTPAQMPATSLRPFYIVEHLDKHPTWGANQRRGAIVATTRPFNWSAKLGYIDVSPVRGIEKPQAKKRDSKLKPEDFTALIALVKPKDPFHDLLAFAWQSGCRPQEARHIEARHVRLDYHRIEIPAEEAKGKRRWRVIYLSPEAEAIVVRLMQQHPAGKLFRNVDGNEWRVDAVGCRFGRLKAKLGTRFAAYDLRHAFATRKLKEGFDPITVASLLGHKDAAMLCKYYEGVSDDGEHLLSALKRSAN